MLLNGNLTHYSPVVGSDLFYAYIALTGCSCIKRKFIAIIVKCSIFSCSSNFPTEGIQVHQNQHEYQSDMKVVCWYF